MYRTIEDFRKDWAYESEMTAKIFGNITDESMATNVIQGGRSLGFLGWHIVICLGMATEAGLPFQVPAEFNPPPAGAGAMKEAYEKFAADLAATVEANWKDHNLLEEVQMYGSTWTRGYALFAMVKHQTHHRGQMTVLMRQAGLTVPGAYGPAREEWGAMGMEALP